MPEKKKNSKLMTTHCPPNRKPQMLAQPMVINGNRALAYMKGEEVYSYIPWEEAQEQVYKENLPSITLDF